MTTLAVQVSEVVQLSGCPTMTIKARIALGIAFLLTIIVLLSALAVYYFNAINSRTESVYSDSLQRLAATETAIIKLNTLSATLMSVDKKSQWASEASAFRSTLIHNVADLFGPKPDKAELFIAEQLWHSLDSMEAQVNALEQSGSEGYQRRFANLSLTLLDLNQQLQALYTMNEQAVSDALVFTKDEIADARIQLSLLGAFCVVFALVVLIWLPRYVTYPIAAFSESINRIAAGNYKTRLDVKRGDEFGRLAENFNTMASRLEQSTDQSLAEVLDSRNRLFTLVNQLDEMILGIDAERRIVFINAAMERYLGLEGQIALGLYMPDLALTKPRLQQLFEPIALGKNVSHEPILITEPDGARSFLQQRVVRIQHESDGSVSGYIILLTDVTDLEEKSHRQSDFLATLSHEMKTPISAIRMSVNLMEDPRIGQLDEDQKQLLGTVRQNTDRLLRMVNEVLELSQNKAGEIKLKLDTVELKEILAELRDSLSSLLREHNLSLEIYDVDSPYRLEADREKITWVLNNLLSNAIRYSPTGSTIKAIIKEVPGGVELAVEDSGPGIAASDRERIFARYKRAKDDATKGTGLGLAISREYVEAHGGRIYLDVRYEQGARFVLELPRRLPETLRARYLRV